MNAIGIGLTLMGSTLYSVEKYVAPLILSQDVRSSDMGDVRSSNMGKNEKDKTRKGTWWYKRTMHRLDSIFTLFYKKKLLRVIIKFFNKVFQQIEINLAVLYFLFWSEVRNCSGTEEGRVWCRTNYVRDNKSIRIPRTLYQRNQADAPFTKTVRHCVDTTPLTQHYSMISGHMRIYLIKFIRVPSSQMRNLFPLQTSLHFPGVKLYIQ